jgi:hypothetical protein
MTTPAIWPCPGCPARHGAGADLAASRFTLVVEDCERSPAGYPISTEVFGYFRVRHEAPFHRMGVRDPCRQAVAAA